MFGGEMDRGRNDPGAKGGGRKVWGEKWGVGAKGGGGESS